jgi:hypothetical protein
MSNDSNLILIVPFKERKLQVPLEATPWPKASHARASVNSFGIGGANAHVRSSDKQRASIYFVHTIILGRSRLR